MGTMNNTEIINFLKDNPGSTAQEIGVTPVEMNRLAAKGIVEKVGNRKTGTRGRPPVEWALPGAELPVREAVNTVNAPALPNIDPALRAALDDEARRQIEYIEGEFAGKHGPRELADYNLLRSRYVDIIKATSRKVNVPAPVIDFDDDEQEDNA